MARTPQMLVSRLMLIRAEVIKQLSEVTCDSPIRAPRAGRMLLRRDEALVARYTSAAVALDVADDVIDAMPRDP